MHRAVIDLEPGDDPEEVRTAASKALRKRVIDECVKFKKKLDKPKKE